MDSTVLPPRPGGTGNSERSNIMATYIIPQKPSNTGSIHDIASQHFDREIKFAPGCKYAVVLASYYGGKGYSTHKTAEAAIAASKSNREYSHQIIDTEGKEYVVKPGWTDSLILAR
jgi:hypothetical protein